ncbi:hypothetical protein [Streptosporangium sp. 'caverna']|uniref:hypothetical protein n=1 Tax=Streptosporangium sp. 'caverna' TaxID=2202249 RepID=UPI000D7DDCE6|nr:hypothetical protein [Streptosporangium sp. 'caverna']AWS46795.1 hypothetical protein DKM19_41360 [Streptosporangium sp. 'caverna']
MTVATNSPASAGAGVTTGPNARAGTGERSDPNSPAGTSIGTGSDATTDSRTATGAGAGVLERRYRRLLLGYPRSYRSGYGGELIATLLDTAEPGRTLPSARESFALIVGGLRTRVTYATERPAWVDGVHLGVLALSVAQLAMLVPYATAIPLWVGLSALAVVLIMRGWVRTALPVTVLVAVKVCSITLGRTWLDVTLLPVYPDPIWGGGALYGGGGPVAPMIGYTLIVLGLLALAAREPRSIGARSWLWWAAIPALAGADPAGLDFTGGPGPLAAARVAVEIGILALAIWAGHVARDPRWAMAAVIYLIPVCAVYAENLGAQSSQDVAHLALLVFLTALAVIVPYRAKRHVLL